MSKEQTNCSIDTALKKKAKEQGIDLSAALTNKLRLMTSPNPNHVPEDSVLFKCSTCGQIIEYGFLCEEAKRFCCETCENAMITRSNSTIYKFPCRVHTDHEHIRIPALRGSPVERTEEVPGENKQK